MKWLMWILASIVGLIVVAVLVLLVLGRREGAATVKATVEVGRPPDLVYAWLTEPQRLTRWVGWLVEVRPVTPGPRTVGSRSVWVMDDPNMKERLEIPGEVIAYEPSRRLSTRVQLPGAFEGTNTYTLTDLGGGRTRLDHVGEYRFHHWFARLLGPIVRSHAQKKLHADLARLKSLAESEPSAVAASTAAERAAAER